MADEYEIVTWDLLLECFLEFKVNCIFLQHPHVTCTEKNKRLKDAPCIDFFTDILS